jgi:NADH-quinone oxidoreductase subunit N
MPIGDVAPELVLAIGAVLVVLAASFSPRERHDLCAWLSLAVLSAAAAWTAVLHRSAAPTLTFAGTWALDAITAWATYGILGTTALIVLLSPRWFRTDRRHGEWYAILLFSALGAVLMAGAADLSELMVAVLLASVTGYTLASYHRSSRMAAEAGAKFFLLGALANPTLFLGIVFLYGLAGTTGYEGIGAAIGGGVDGVALAAGVALVTTGLLFELGAFPVHPWVPDVAQGSPAPAAAFLTVAPKIGALVALARFVSLVPDDALAWRAAIAVIAALTMTLGNLAALWQGDVRRLLGWSTVSQAGYGLMAVVALGRSGLALPSLLLFVFGYAVANLAAFSVVVALRGRTALEDYRGLGRSRPGHALAMTVALLSLTGIPPLVGFAAKLTLFGASIEAGYAWLAVVAVLNTVVSLFYYLRVIAPMYLSAPARPVALLGGPAGLAVGISTVLVVALGLAAQVLFDGVTTASLLPR